jgi:hypothetical protein
MIDKVLDYATILLAVFTAGSLMIGLIVYYRQCNAMIFLEYTKRYSEVMNRFPAEALRARLDLTATLPEKSDELSLAVLRYLNLCAEEFYLCKQKYLSQHVWKIWELELKRTLSSPLFVREWTELREEFRSFPEFLDYVNAVQNACT